MEKKEKEIKEVKKEETSKNNKKRNIIIMVVSVVLLIIVLFLLWFFNRKFEVTFDYNNGTEKNIVLVKYNKIIDKKDVKTKEDLGNKFIDWYLVIEEKENEDVLAEKPFDFTTKITKDTKLKAVYEKAPQTITVTFDSKGGTKVDPITMNKGTELNLPKNPTYSGYTFAGWFDKNNKQVANKTILNEDTTLYAKWNKVVVKKEEKISLSLSNYYMHRDGTKTSRATASTENASGNVTYSLSSSICARINSSTGVITAIPYSELEGNSQAEQVCEVGQTVTVTAKLPSGKSASKTLTLEGDLVLSAGNKAYISSTTDINAGTNDFTVKANQNVKWSTSGTVSGTVTTNSTICNGKANASNSRFATIVATTLGGQRVEVHWYAVVN